MRGSLIICLLLATAVLAKPRPKRSLGYIKNLVTTKLFGGNTVVVVRPKLANNETYQLFKIPGYDDVLIKVKRIEKAKPNITEDKEKEKPVDPVIVKPEVAIIGSYLGTTTEKETMLAIEIVKSLLQSGILTGGRNTWMKELVVPQPPHLEYIDEQNVILPTQVFEEEQGHIFVPMGGMQQMNHNTIPVPVYPEYPPLFVSPEVNPTPLHSIYSYKQKGPDADMTYESYNNKDVIVTRTEKEPPLPQFIKLRIPEVANIGARPYLVQSPLQVNPYSYSNPGMDTKNVGPDMLPYVSHRIAKPNKNGEVESEYIGNTYSYKQKSPDADMTYKSYNNKDVIVTRTEKEPPLPQFIKLRIAEVANIGARPYLVQSPLQVNPYSYSNPGMDTENVGPDMLPYVSHRIAKPNKNGAVESEYIGNNDYSTLVIKDRDTLSTIASPYYIRNNVQQVIRCKEKNVGKVCPYEKTKISQNKHTGELQENKPLQEIVVNQQNEPITNNKGETNVNKMSINELLKNHSVNGQLVSQYIYKQMNHHSHDNYTEVKVGEDIQITKGTVETHGKLPNNYVFIPPKTADSPPLSALRLNLMETSKDDVSHAFTSNLKANEGNHFVPSAPRHKSIIKQSVSHDFKHNPIVVSEQFIVENREKLSNTANAKTNEEATNENSIRGDIPGSTF